MSGRSIRCVNGVSRPRKRKPVWNRPELWTAAEVDYLEANYGRISDEAIARKLGRGVVGVRLKAKRIGRRKRHIGLSSRAVAEMFGIACSKTIVHWVELGLLRGRQTFAVGLNRRWLIDDESVERLIVEHGEYVDVDKMPDSYYRDLALKNRWYSVVEVEQLTGKNADVLHHQIARGRYEARKRYDTTWYVPEAVLQEIKAEYRPPKPLTVIAERRRRKLLARKKKRLGLAA